MTTGVSVIICCYNSVSRLHDTLTHLLKQKYSGFGFEIIIVDNASTDETSAFAEKLLSNQTGISYTVVNEPESGLSFARKRGYITAQYGFLLYCDDDLAKRLLNHHHRPGLNNMKLILPSATSRLLKNLCRR